MMILMSRVLLPSLGRGSIDVHHDLSYFVNVNTYARYVLFIPSIPFTDNATEASCPTELPTQ